MNFQPANHLLTANALEKGSGRQVSLEWLDAKFSQNPDLQLIRWTRKFYMNDADSEKIPEDARAREIIRLEKYF